MSAPGFEGLISAEAEVFRIHGTADVPEGIGLALRSTDPAHPFGHIDGNGCAFIALGREQAEKLIAMCRAALDRKP